MSTPQLYWLGPDGQENVLPLVAAEILIGRKGDADVVLNNQHVSRHHAKLVKTPDGYSLQDLGSTHGTFVNEIRVEQHSSETRRQDFARKRSRRSALFRSASRRRQRLNKRTRHRSSSARLSIWESCCLRVHPISKRFRAFSIFNTSGDSSSRRTRPSRKSWNPRSRSAAPNGDSFWCAKASGFGYAAGMNGHGRNLSLSHFKTSHTVVDDVVQKGAAVFMVEGLDSRYKEQASIVAMNLRAVACLPLTGIPVAGGHAVDSRHSLSRQHEKNAFAVRSGPAHSEQARRRSG